MKEHSALITSAGVAVVVDVLDLGLQPAAQARAKANRRGIFMIVTPEG
jgi:hypothetical protein